MLHPLDKNPRLPTHPNPECDRGARDGARNILAPLPLLPRELLRKSIIIDFIIIQTCRMLSFLWDLVGGGAPPRLSKIYLLTTRISKFYS